MGYKRWIIESEGIPIGFFVEKSEATEALTKYVEHGTIKELELQAYKCWTNGVIGMVGE